MQVSMSNKVHDSTLKCYKILKTNLAYNFRCYNSSIDSSLLILNYSLDIKYQLSCI